MKLSLFVDSILQCKKPKFKKYQWYAKRVSDFRKLFESDGEMVVVFQHEDRPPVGWCVSQNPNTRQKELIIE